MWTCYWGKCNSAEWGHKGRFTSVKERRENLNSIWEVIREREDVQGRRNSLNEDLQQERKMEWWGKRTLRFHVRGLTLVACLFLSTEPIKRCRGSRQMEIRKRRSGTKGQSVTHRRVPFTRRQTSRGWIVFCTQKWRKAFSGREWRWRQGWTAKSCRWV